MLDENVGGGESEELVPWTSPDGIEVKVPSGKLKDFQGLNERFNKLTTREQQLAVKEREYGDPERLKQKVREEWLEGMTKEEWADIAKQNGWSDQQAAAAQKTVEQNPQKSSESDAAYARRIEELESKLNQFQESTEKDKHERAVMEAQQNIANQMASLADQSDDFKHLSSDQSRESAMTRAWMELEKSKYDITIAEAMDRAIKAQVTFEQSIIEGHRKTKSAGPGLPGAGGGDLAKPSDANDPAQRRKHLRAFTKALAG